LSRARTAQPLTLSTLEGGGKAAELVKTNYEEMVTGALSEFIRDELSGALESSAR